MVLSALLVSLLSVQSGASAYDEARAALEETRVSLAKKLARARTKKARRRVYAEARAAILESLTEDLFPAWYGTEWAFGGHSDTPQEGQIACGIFVTTLLEHAGFRLNRIRMGQLASEHIALSLTSERNLRRYRNRPVEEVERDLIRWGPGLYAVGLDYHAGLAVVDAEGRARFIHSSYYPSKEVLEEPFVGDNPLAFSRYRVFAKLLDDRMVARWLAGKRFRTFVP